MKKLFTQLFTLLLFFVSSTVYAQHNLYVCKKGGEVTVMSSNDVDSISFSADEWLYTINTSLPTALTERTFQAKTSVSLKEGITLLSGSSPTIGVCYSTETDQPTIDNAKHITLGNSTGTYNISVRNLLKGYKYYYRTYVKLLDNVFYGNVQSITMLGEKEVLGEHQKFAEGHIFVDLGLPSGLYWATCNLGAENETDFGDYYAWGETTTKSSYDIDNSIWHNKEHSGNLTPSEHAATVNWGDSTRMPTHAEICELADNCTWEWKTNYKNTSVNGRLATGPNGQSIFFPAAGGRKGSGANFVGSLGAYWTSTPQKSSLGFYAFGLFLYSNYVEKGGGEYPSTGLPVRAVCQ